MKLTPSLGTLVLLGLFTTQFILPISAFAQGIERTPSQMMNDRTSLPPIPGGESLTPNFPGYLTIELEGIPTEREAILANWQNNLIFGSPDSAYNLAVTYLDAEDPLYDPAQAILHFMLADLFEHPTVSHVLAQLKTQVSESHWEQFNQVAAHFVEQNVILPPWSELYARTNEPFVLERSRITLAERGRFSYPKDLLNQNYIATIALVTMIDEHGAMIDHLVPKGYSRDTYRNIERLAATRRYEPSNQLRVSIIDMSLAMGRSAEENYHAMTNALHELWPAGLAGNIYAQVTIAPIVRRLVGERHKDIFEFNDDDLSVPVLPASINEPHEIKEPLMSADIIMGRRGRAEEVTLIDADSLSAQEKDQAIAAIKGYRFGRGTEQGQHYRIVEDEKDGLTLRRVNQLSSMAKSSYWYDRAARQNIREARLMFLNRNLAHWVDYSLKHGDEQERVYAAVRIYFDVDNEEYKAEAKQVLEQIAASGSERYAEIASRALTQVAVAAN